MAISTLEPSAVASKQTKRNQANAAWGVCEYLAQAISLVCLTPLLIKHLGDASFGLLVIAMTIMGLNGLFTLGMGPATLHFVAKYREGKRYAALPILVETSLLTNVILGLLAGTLLFLFSGLVASRYETANADTQTILSIIKFAAIGLPFVFLANSMDSVLRGFEEFNLAVPIRAVTKIATTAVQITCVLMGYRILTLIGVTVVFQGIQSIAGWYITRTRVLPSLQVIPRFSYQEFRQFLSYGFYVWLSSLMNTARHSGELLILAAILGPKLLTLFAIPQKVLSQIHQLLSKAFAFMFPYATKLVASENTQELKGLYILGTRGICSLALLAVPPIAVCCAPLLSFWLNPEISQKITPILQILAVRYAVFPLSILTSNLLLAAGKTKVITVIVTINAIVILPLSAILAYYYGVTGAALAQLVVFGPVLFNRFYVERTLFGKGKFSTVALPVILIASLTTALMLAVRIPVDFDLFKTLAIGVAIGVLSSAISWFTLSYSYGIPLSIRSFRAA